MPVAPVVPVIPVIGQKSYSNGYTATVRPIVGGPSALAAFAPYSHVVTLYCDGEVIVFDVAHPERWQVTADRMYRTAL